MAHEAKKPGLSGTYPRTEDVYASSYTHIAQLTTQMVASLLRELPKKTQATCKFWFHTVRFWPNCPICLHLENGNRKT